MTQPIEDIAPELQPPLPDPIRDLPEDELVPRITAAREALGDRVVLLGHHYQQEDVVRFADHRGDSFSLAKDGAACRDADWIVFCGVHFMAEAADILRAPHQAVILPDLTAGCSMADMAPPFQVDDCWSELLRRVGREDLVPITYMNSAASLKAFVGREGGSVCTSSNALAVMEWAFEQGSKLLFFPDQHLGRNVAHAAPPKGLGMPLDDMVVWNPREFDGGLTDAELRAAKIILWQGHCSVHAKFTPGDCDAFREAHPDGRIVVHPECIREVVEKADDWGSTSFIKNYVEEAPAGTVIAVGTEINMVERLARENPDKQVVNLGRTQCLCTTMYRIDPRRLLWVLEELGRGNVVNRIQVDDDVKHWAKVALDRMLGIV